jgi:formamidopyrimidine-DNA glycosylase
MPELAEVEFFRLRWNPGVGGRIVKVEVHEKARPLKGVDVAELKKTLTGAQLISSARHGKQLSFTSNPPPSSACTWG